MCDTCCRDACCHGNCLVVLVHLANVAFVDVDLLLPLHFAIIIQPHLSCVACMYVYIVDLVLAWCCTGYISVVPTYMPCECLCMFGASSVCV